MQDCTDSFSVLLFGPLYSCPAFSTPARQSSVAKQRQTSRADSQTVISMSPQLLIEWLAAGQDRR